MITKCNVILTIPKNNGLKCLASFKNIFIV